MTLFDQCALEQQVRAALQAAEIPAEHRTAVVGVVDEAGARVVVATKIGTRWQVEGSIAHEWQGDTRAAVVVKGSW